MNRFLYLAIVFTILPVMSAKATEPPKIIAHRGDSQKFPENTMSAVLSAVEVKSDLIEFDVRVVKNGDLYLFHDANLERFKLGKREVAQLTKEEIEKIDVGAWFDPKFAGERAPLLADITQACVDGGTIPLIERKTGSAEAYVKVIRDLKLEKKVIVQAFDWKFLTALRKMEPKIMIGALSGDPLTDESWKKLTALNPEWVGWKEKILDEAGIKRFQKAGFKVAVWTVNDLARIRQFTSWGVDGLITDRPGDARKAVEQMFESE